MLGYFNLSNLIFLWIKMANWNVLSFLTCIGTLGPLLNYADSQSYANHQKLCNQILNKSQDLKSFPQPISKNNLIGKKPFFLNGEIFLNVDPQSVMGPAQINLYNGQIINNGLISLDFLSADGSIKNPPISIFSGGTCQGQGELWVSGQAVFFIPVTQGTVTVGQGFDVNQLPYPKNVNGVLFVNNTALNAAICITGSGSLKGQGTCSNLALVEGDIYPGLDTTSLGTITVLSSAAFDTSSSSLSVAINGQNSNNLNVIGTLSFDPTSSINIASIQNAPTSDQSYPIASFSSFQGILPNLVNLTSNTGTFTLTLLPNQLLLNASFNPGNIPIPIPSSEGLGGGFNNVVTTAKLLNKIDGNCSLATQNIINLIKTLPPPQQLAALIELTPAFKKMQFTLEKLDLLLHKELEMALYSEHKGAQILLIGGYDSLDQKPENGYLGYSVQTFYQLATVSQDFTKVKGVWGLGISESSMGISFQRGQAHYTTAHATMGFATHHNRWQLGIDGLFSFSFFKGSRNINFIEETAQTKHNILNASIDGKLNYSWKKTHDQLNVYDQFGFNYGHENKYHEYPDTGANLAIKGENIYVFRNALGLSFDIPRHLDIRIFLDAAWVYERYFNSNSFYAAFEQTSVYGLYTDWIPAKNYARIHTGFSGQHKHVDWKLTYTFLQGKGFLENSYSLKLAYKF